jgi:thiamine kinase-like enzyme
VNDSAEDRIRALPLWTGRIEIAKLPGGLTNRNYVVADAHRKCVVRLGGDVPVHGIMRFNEHAASRAAAAGGISPPVLHAEPGVLVIGFIEGSSLAEADVRRDAARCTALVKRVHRELPLHLRGPLLAFDVFHVLRDYAHSLRDGGSRMAPDLARLAAIAATLEREAGCFRPVYGHNDLLPANFLDDGDRLWLVDWDYAGYATPLFDLGGLSSNSGFAPDEERAMLEAYFEAPATAPLLRSFRAVQAASLLRETLWSLVQELHSTLDFDYRAYSDRNLAAFAQAWAAFQSPEGASCGAH